MTTFIQKYFAQFDVEKLLMKLVSLVVLYVLFWVAKRVIRLLVKRALKTKLHLGNKDNARQQTVLYLVENILNYTLYFILIYSTLVILGLPVSSLLAGAGIAGVAIGLGAQGFLSDLVNGFFILIERQFDVGESVRLTNGPIVVEGMIVSVGIRTTQVRDADGTLHFIPNRNILVVSNKSRGDMRAQIDIPLYPTANLERVSEIIEQVNLREIPQYEQIKGCTVLGAQASPNGQFSYRVHLMVENGQQYLIYHKFYTLYQEALVEAGIELPLQNVVVGK